MEDNLSNAISQLQNMLSSDEGKKNIEDMIGSLGISTTSPEDPVFNPENMLIMNNIMETFKRRDDPRSQLLLALKPYLSNARSARLETAIRLLSLGRLPDIMKAFRG